MAYELFQNESGKYYFRLKARNGQIILQSQAYTSKAAARQAIHSAAENSRHEERFERRDDGGDQEYFVLKGANGEVIGRSEMYRSSASLQKGLRSVMKNAPDEEVRDLSPKTAGTDYLKKRSAADVGGREPNPGKAGPVIEPRDAEEQNRRNRQAKRSGKME